MAGKIEKALGIASELVRSGGGIFDVHLGDKLVYSKFASGGFPDEDQLVKRLKEG